MREQRQKNNPERPPAIDEADILQAQADQPEHKETCRRNSGIQKKYVGRVG
jgi:hypothetical protein